MACQKLPKVIDNERKLRYYKTLSFQEYFYEV